MQPNPDPAGFQGFQACLLVQLGVIRLGATPASFEPFGIPKPQTLRVIPLRGSIRGFPPAKSDDGSTYETFTVVPGDGTTVSAQNHQTETYKNTMNPEKKTSWKCMSSIPKDRVVMVISSHYAGVLAVTWDQPSNRWEPAMHDVIADFRDFMKEATGWMDIPE